MRSVQQLVHLDAAQDHGVAGAVLCLPSEPPLEVADLGHIDAGAQAVISRLLCLGMVFGSFVGSLRFDLGRFLLFKLQAEFFVDFLLAADQGHFLVAFVQKVAQRIDE